MELGGPGWGKLLYINWEMVPRMRIGTWSEGLEETKSRYGVGSEILGFFPF